MIKSVLLESFSQFVPAISAKTIAPEKNGFACSIRMGFIKQVSSIFAGGTSRVIADQSGQ
jgi:hypothetical protein